MMQDKIARHIRLFDEVIVAVSKKSSKEPLFSLAERVKMIEDAIAGKPQVKVESFSGLVVNFATERKAQSLVRGVRMLSDFEYEFQMALTNRKLNSKVETIFLMPNEAYSYLTSSLIKEIASMGGRVDDYVPSQVCQALHDKFDGQDLGGEA